MMVHRIATAAEVQTALESQQAIHGKTLEFWTEEMRKAIDDDGYRNEVCEKCGGVFLAFKHFVNCPESNCPMRGTGPSVAEMILDEMFTGESKAEGADHG